MAGWSEVSYSRMKQTGRIDSEYFQPHLLQYEAEINRSGHEILPLGSIIRGGYRVIYENTKIINEPLPGQKTVRFLQAANIQSAFPTVDYEGLGLVSYSDWERYPKGRIRRGELLIEVKGKASKVAVVPDDYPLDTLVTGTVYKFLVDEQKVHLFYLLAYLLSKYGFGFRQRCLTNTLIGFVNKEELYQIPVPILDKTRQEEISSRVEMAFTQMRRSDFLYASAEELLLSELGLGQLDLSPTLFYERDFSETRHAARLDAEYFQPKYYRLLEQIIRSKRAVRLGDYLQEPSSRGIQPEYDDEGDVLVINSQHVGKNSIDLETNRRTNNAFVKANRNKGRVRKYDVLLNSTGYITIGRAKTLLEERVAVVDSHVTILRIYPKTAISSKI